ncbi:uncharacterized protein E0L32_004511 [Thyridium curvatum]|uniref:Fumarylacetoacetase-like C-terminal domain-containing protein n=1 Tax=Thyridium curvatum TaxID=1093900 RepID=A0A507B9E4_9PEZI|nr:uncharacterized protein E0L32_004511 [Thyridium curvatum]TPX15234.1 hypothetical protein E0L32_004511 [Thyridium curvatum]
MSTFQALVRFEADDGQTYFADIEPSNAGSLCPGHQLEGFSSFAAFTAKRGGRSVRLAKAKIPQHPPLWTKPAAALANPGEDIHIDKFCTTSYPDYEGEYVFVTSRKCKNVTPEEAEDCILGYATANELSCRLFQDPDQMGGQYFFAKAFDKFAPIGPVLVSPEIFANGGQGRKLTTKLNGKVMQEASIDEDQIFSPAQVLSWMSQATTIPAGTAVMTGTPAGVGYFHEPKRLLRDGDVVEIELEGLPALQNKIVFEA